MSSIRPAAVAGMFYPQSRGELRAAVDALLVEASPHAQCGEWPPKALIVPHAGYVYSGPIAARAYGLLSNVRSIIKRVVLLGPVHRVPIRGLALPVADALASPLGVIDIDQDGARLALTLPQVRRSEAAHATEHSLEVQLPFLQTVLDDFRIVPLAVGDATAEEVAQVIDLLWGGSESLLVISSDLSHYHRYAEARRIDSGTTEQILALDATLDHDQACGATPINGLLLCTARRRLAASLLDLRNSGDTAGDKSRVVGYAAFAFASAGSSTTAASDRT